jgi:hypothetical protein
MTIDVYIAYAQPDSQWLERLRKQLSAAERIGLVDAWHDGEIEVGADKVEAARRAMEAAEIVVLLLSADFFASEYLYEKEMGRALQLAKGKKVTLVPVLLRDCTWQLTPLAQYQILPKNGKPITDNSWQNPDQALKQVVDEIIRISTALRSGKKPVVAYTQVSKEVTTPEKTISKTIQQDSNEAKSETPLWKLALYAFVGLGAFALVSFLVNLAFTEPTNPPPTAKINTETAESNDDNKDAEIITRAEPTSSDFAPFATLQLGGLEWTAENMAINSSQAVNYADANQTKRYGLLYTLKAAREICPDGWRLPTREDWTSLSAKEIEQLQLTRGGFYNKAHMQIDNVGYYLTSENTAGDQVWVAEFRGNDQTLKMDRRYAHWGMSCRCVR